MKYIYPHLQGVQVSPFIFLFKSTSDRRLMSANIVVQENLLINKT